MMALTLSLERVELMGGDRSTFTEAHEDCGICIVVATKHIVALKKGYAKGTWDNRGY